MVNKIATEIVLTYEFHPTPHVLLDLFFQYPGLLLLRDNIHFNREADRRLWLLTRYSRKVVTGLQYYPSHMQSREPEQWT